MVLGYSNSISEIFARFTNLEVKILLIINGLFSCVCLKHPFAQLRRNKLTEFCLFYIHKIALLR